MAGWISPEILLYPVALTAFQTVLRTSFETYPLLLSTLETVAVDTPAAAATSVIFIFFICYHASLLKILCKYRAAMEFDPINSIFLSYNVFANFSIISE
jgi:hypothetical protein